MGNNQARISTANKDQMSPIRDVSVDASSPLRPGTSAGLKKRPTTPGTTGARRLGTGRNKNSNRKRSQNQAGQNIRHMNTLAMLQKT